MKETDLRYVKTERAIRDAYGGGTAGGERI